MFPFLTACYVYYSLSAATTGISTNIATSTIVVTSDGFHLHNNSTPVSTEVTFGSTESTSLPSISSSTDGRASDASQGICVC